MTRRTTNSNVAIHLQSVVTGIWAQVYVGPCSTGDITGPRIGDVRANAVQIEICRCRRSQQLIGHYHAVLKLHSSVAAGDVGAGRRCIVTRSQRVVMTHRKDAAGDACRARVGIVTSKGDRAGAASRDAAAAGNHAVDDQRAPRSLQTQVVRIRVNRLADRKRA